MRPPPRPHSSLAPAVGSVGRDRLLLHPLGSSDTRQFNRRKSKSSFVRRGLHQNAEPGAGREAHGPSGAGVGEGPGTSEGKAAGHRNLGRAAVWPTNVRWPCRDTGTQRGLWTSRCGQSFSPSSLRWARALCSHLCNSHFLLRALGLHSLAGKGQVKENILSLWFLRKDQPKTVPMPKRPTWRRSPWLWQSAACEAWSTGESDGTAGPTPLAARAQHRHRYLH